MKTTFIVLHCKKVDLKLAVLGTALGIENTNAANPRAISMHISDGEWRYRARWQHVNGQFRSAATRPSPPPKGVPYFSVPRRKMSLP